MTTKNSIKIWMTIKSNRKKNKKESKPVWKKKNDKENLYKKKNEWLWNLIWKKLMTIKTRMEKMNFYEKQFEIKCMTMKTNLIKKWMTMKTSCKKNEWPWKPVWK